MKTILEISGQHFLIPASANINALLAILTKAVPLDVDFSESRSGSGLIYRSAARAPRIEIQLAADDNVIISARLARKAIAERASADAHNTFGS